MFARVFVVVVVDLKRKMGNTDERHRFPMLEMRWGMKSWKVGITFFSAPSVTGEEIIKNPKY